jgi:hypothetical protein
MKRTKISGCKLVWLERAGSSCDGNPSYYADFETPDGETISGKTARNAACAYGITNYSNGRKLATIEYHETRKGNIIFDYIRDTKEEE